MPQVEEVARLATAKGMTVAVAEVDTCGLVAYLLSTVPGASRYFPGGIIAYSNSVKERILGIPRELFQREGAVSRAVALEMARRVRQLLGTHIGVSDTGIAGPTGGTPTKPVGLFYIALSTAEGYEECEERRWQGDRDTNKRQTAEAAIGLLLRYLTRPPSPPGG
ncbi:MAG: CinA family protein [Chloroflexi bacterium]|nr:CinA family protein [Chloroflexota bacterium]